MLIAKFVRAAAIAAKASTSEGFKKRLLLNKALSTPVDFGLGISALTSGAMAAPASVCRAEVGGGRKLERADKTLAGGGGCEAVNESTVPRREALMLGGFSHTSESFSVVLVLQQVSTTTDAYEKKIYKENKVHDRNRKWLP